jgi:DNA segregation ATPase FtsK/SpoIIIE, S-DNA-T family
VQLVISVAGPDPDGAPSDVVLDVRGETPVGDVAAAAARVVAATANAWDRPEDESGEPAPACYLDGRRLDPSATVREVGLVSGDRVGLGAPAPVPPGGWSPGRAGVEWLEVHAVGGRDAGRVWPVAFGTHGIGSAPGNRIRLLDAGLPEYGPVLTVDRRGRAGLTGLARARVTSTGMVVAGRSTSGSGSGPDHGRLTVPEPPLGEIGNPDPRFRKVMEDAALDHARLVGEADGMRPWPVGMDLAIGDTLLRLVRRFDADAAVTPADDVVARDFNRPPRLVPPLLYAPIRLPSPPQVPSRRPIPLVMMLAPMVLGLAFVLLFHSYYFLLIALMSPAMGIANWQSDRRQGGKQYRRDSARFRQRRREAEEEVFAGVGRERIARCSASPDPAMLGLIALGPGSRLWERRRRDADYLTLRVGTVDQPSLMEVEDPARDDGHRKYRWTVPDVPIGIDVPERGVIGVAGPRAATTAVANWLLAQAAVQHSPRDLRVHLLADGDSAGDRWAWARWLPHARPFGPGGGPLVTIGNDPETVVNRVNELQQLVRARTQARSSRMGTVLFAEPDVLVVMDGARRLRDVPGVVQILTDGPAVRVFSICVDALERLLPEECTAVVRCDPDGLVLRQEDAPDVIGIRPDEVAGDWCEDVARALSSLRDVTPDESGGLPERVRLLDLLSAGSGDPPDPDRIARQWARRPASTAFPIGRGFDGPVTFDLVRDGPHGLIAGTTGSGKSELLQTLVASLAAVNRPDEMVFVLVDYKGGSAFHSCVDLPHTLGMVTDLDEALSLRALESLAAELRRREHVLARYGAKDLSEYRGLRSRDPQLPPLPRLLLVIDEFATMARETPSFVPGLVSIAQRGRSLGVHLILATQRPGGVVTPDIKANTNLRIALRVTDPNESTDVIDTVDAAYISTGTPGRALARLAHRSTLPFQTAYVGSPIDDGSVVEDLPKVLPPPRAEALTWSALGRPSSIAATTDEEVVVAPESQSGERTDLDALVEAIRAAGELVQSVPQPSPWLPALPPQIDLRQLDARADEPRPAADGLRAVPYALVDLPAQQAQTVEYLQLDRTGHLFVVGAPRAGRSQVLRTLAGVLARGNSSADVHLYGIDAAGGALAILSELPHCGGVVGRTDVERLGRLITFLSRQLALRHELFAEHSVADLTELRTARPGPERPAHIVVLVDGWDALAAMTTDHDGGVLQDALLELLREGAGVGIHMVMTSDRALLMGRVAAFSEAKLLLRTTDRTDLTMAGIPTHRQPAVIGAGRSWRASDAAEMQIALLDPDPSGQAQAQALREIGEVARARDAALPAGSRPHPIAPLPSTLLLPDVLSRLSDADRVPLRGVLGIGGSELAPIVLDFSGRAQTFLVAGPPGAGRSNALATIGVSLLAGGTRLLVLSPRESPLRRLASHPAVQVVVGNRPDPAELQDSLAAGGPLVLLIDDVDLFGMGNALDPVLREVVSIGRDQGIGIAYAGTPEGMAATLGGWMGEAKRSRQGVLLAPQSGLEGDLIGARLAPSQLRQPIRPGRGITPLPGRSGVGTVVIPHTVLR